MADGGEMFKLLNGLSKVVETGGRLSRPMQAAGLLQIVVSLVPTGLVWAQTDWPSFGHDPGASRYSPLKQINISNVSRLQRAWTFHTGKPGSEAIPLVVGGVLY